MDFNNSNVPDFLSFLPKQDNFAFGKGYKTAPFTPLKNTTKNIQIPLRTVFEKNIKIVDENNQPLPNTAVQYLETKKGNTTDFNGNVLLNSSNGKNIKISHLGFNTKTYDILNIPSVIQLTPSQEMLDEIVVKTTRNTQKLESFKTNSFHKNKYLKYGAIALGGLVLLKMLLLKPKKTTVTKVKTKKVKV